MRRAIALLSLITVTGCAKSGPTGATCPTDSTLTYASFGEQFMTSYCVSCHSSTLTGAERHRAPLGVDFNTLQGIRAHLADIDEAAASGPNRTNTEMPEEAPRPTAAERRQLGEWIACGAP